ncbi:MAG TPA: EF-Tu/IF-2/RF-3 family GTPase [Candidatus Angelobacter sp.]|jgi:elongation factor Tu
MNVEELVDQPFLMTIRDVFSVTGRGTVITGRIESGKVKSGEEVEILGTGVSRRAVVVSIAIIKRQRDAGQSEDNVGLVLRGVSKDEIKWGMFVKKPHQNAATTTRSGGV